MTPAGARAAIGRGTPFGDVYPLLTDDLNRAELRAWFARNPAVPNLAARRAAAKPQLSAGTCEQCGGSNLTRTGTCVTCLDCGSNNGCG